MYFPGDFPGELRPACDACEVNSDAKREKNDRVLRSFFNKFFILKNHFLLKKYIYI